MTDTNKEPLSLHEAMARRYEDIRTPEQIKKDQEEEEAYTKAKLDAAEEKFMRSIEAMERRSEQRKAAFDKLKKGVKKLASKIGLKDAEKAKALKDIKSKGK